MLPFTSELFEFNKMLFIYIVTVCILFVWIIKSILLKKIILNKTVIDIPIFLFLISQIISTIFSIDKHTSFFGYYGRFNGGLLSIITYIILYYGMVSNLKRDDIFNVIKISLLGSILVILWGLPGRFGKDMTCLFFMGQFDNSCWTDQFHPETRLFSTLGQPNWLGAYLAVNFFLALFMILKKNAFALKTDLFWGAYILLNLTTLLFTRSRSAILSLFISLILFVILAVITSLKTTIYKNIKFITVLILSLLAVLFVVKTDISIIDNILNKPQNILSRFTLQQEIRKSAQSRQESQGYKVEISESSDIRKIVWKGAWELGKRFPFFGSGVETFAYAYYFVRPASHNLTSEWDYLYNKAHNEYLNYLATTGTFGLMSYLFVILFVSVYFLKQIAKSENITLSIALFSAYITVIFNNFFGFSTTTQQIYFYLIPAALIVAATKGKDTLITASKNTNSLKKVLLLTVASASSILLIIYFINYWLADVTFTKAETMSKSGNYQTAIPLYQKALKFKYEHVYQDKLSFVLANVAVLAAYQKQTDLSGKLVDLSKFYNKQSLQVSPENVLYWKTKAKNEYLFYQINLKTESLENGMKSLLKARQLAPTDPKIPYSLTIFYSLLSDEEKDSEKKVLYKNLSMKSISDTLALKPNFRDGYALKASLHKKYNETAEAKKAYQYILEKINPKDEESLKEIKSL